MFAALIAALMLFSPSAIAANYTLYTSKTGGASDSNPCTVSQKCLTLQRAVNVCPDGAYCVIMPDSGGVYDEKVSVIYYKVISIIGAGQSSTCTDRSLLTITDRVGGTPVAGALLYAQDHAILTIACAKLVAYASGTQGFVLRQFSIGDANDVECNYAGGGYMSLCLVANEQSKMNAYNAYVRGNHSRWGYAADNSQLSVGGVVDIANGLAIDWFISALFNSVVTYYPTPAAPVSMTGSALQCSDAIFKSIKNIPGLPERHPSFYWMSGSDALLADCKIR